MFYWIITLLAIDAVIVTAFIYALTGRKLVFADAMDSWRAGAKEAVPFPATLFDEMRLDSEGLCPGDSGEAVLRHCALGTVPAVKEGGTAVDAVHSPFLHPDEYDELFYSEESSPLVYGPICAEEPGMGRKRGPQKGLRTYNA